jgi:hypothetical protein
MGDTNLNNTYLDDIYNLTVLPSELNINSNKNIKQKTKKQIGGNKNTDNKHKHTNKTLKK